MPAHLMKRRLTPLNPSTGGKVRRLGWWIPLSASRPSSQRLPMTRQPCSGLKPDLWRLRLSSPYLSMKETRIDPQPFRLLFSCAVCDSLYLCNRAPSCRCGRPLDVLGHHRAACANAGVLGRRGWVLENVAARVCREAGGRVRTNLAVRDMDLGAMSSLMDVAWKSLLTDCHCGVGPSWRWTPPWFALSRTMVSLSGALRPPTGSLWHAPRRRKERTYPELTGEHGRARLVVLGVEVGGR